MSDRCTWEIFKETETEVSSRPCGKVVAFVYEKDGRFYPRCTSHASEKARNWALANGFTVQPFEATP